MPSGTTAIVPLLALHNEGLTSKDIARRLGMKDRTMRHWLKLGIPAEARRRRKRSSRFDPHAASVLKRWQEGERNGLRLCEEIQAQGYKGSSRTIYRFLAARKRELARARGRSRMAIAGFYCTQGGLVVCT